MVSWKLFASLGRFLHASWASFAFLGALLVALASLLLKCFPFCRVALQRHVQRNLSKAVASMDFTLARGPQRFRPGNKPILV